MGLVALRVFECFQCTALLCVTRYMSGNEVKRHAHKVQRWAYSVQDGGVTHKRTWLMM